MKKISRFLAVMLVLVLVVASLTACDGDEDKTKDTNTTQKEDKKASQDHSKESASDEKVDEIYYLNFKPEIAEVYNSIAADYEAETGIRVK